MVRILLLVGLGACLCVASADDSGERPRPSAAASAASPSQLVIIVRERRLTVKVRNVSLERVLEEISRKAEVAITQGSGIGREPISVDFQDLAIDDGLRRILTDNDAFYFYGADGKARAALKVVWVYAKGRGRGVAPVPMESWASTKELEGRLSDPDPQARAQAVESLLERKREPSVALMALHDVDEQVRSRALYAALSQGMSLPSNSLRTVALTDQSADVRYLALEGLAADPAATDVRSIAEQLQDDPNPLVRRKAEEVLRRLNPVGPSSPPATPQNAPHGVR
jgi:HEAT repeat protein